jgi:hypothetical protein
MAVTYVGRNIVCLESDIAGLSTTLAANTQAWATNTGRVYVFDGTNWHPRNVKAPPRFLIYQDTATSTTYCKDSDGLILSSSSTAPEIPMQYALDQGNGRISIMYSTYAFSNSFTGLNIDTDNTQIDIDPMAVLQVKSGYTGYVFKIIKAAGNIHNTQIRGGRIFEATPRSKAYTAFLYETQVGGGSIYGTFMYDVYISRPGTGIHLKNLTADTAMNGNAFTNVWINEPIVGVNFESDVPGGNGNGINRGVFTNVVCQDDTTAHDLQVGFKNIRNTDNMFIACKVWDLSSPSTQKTFTVHQDAEYTNIIGGIMARQSAGSRFFIDNSPTTFIWAPEYGIMKYAGSTLLESMYLSVGNRRKGTYNTATTATGTGLCGGGFTAYAGGINSSQISNTFGPYRLQSTTAAANAGAGYRYTILVTSRGLNPSYKIRFQLNQTSSISPYYGLASGIAADYGSDDPLNALSGIILTSRKADTNFFIGVNDGSGATTFTNTGIARDTLVHTFSLEAQEQMTNKWRWSIDNAGWTDLTDTNIPAATTGLTPIFQLQTGDANLKSQNIYGVEIES